MTDQILPERTSSLHSSDVDQASQSTSTTSHSAPIATVPPPIHNGTNGNGVTSSVPPSFAPLEPLNPESALKPIGIQNEQNTCFLNTVFQALMATQPLISVLNSAPELGLIRSPLNALRTPLVSTSLIPSLLPEALEPPLYPLLPVTRAFLVALQKGWRMKDAKGGTIGYEEFSSDRSMRLNHLLREMAKKYDQYDDYTQQDAHELMRHLLDSMEMEEKDVIKIVHPPPPPAPKSSHTRGRADGISPLPSPLPSRSSSPVRSTAKPDVPQTASAPNLAELPKEIPENQRLIPFVDVLFGGSLASVIVCENCRAVSHTYEPFLDISLSLKRASADKTRKRDRFKAALGLKSRGTGGTYARHGIDVPSSIASESELSDTEHHRKSIDEEKNRRKSIDPDERPKVNETTPDATPARQSSFKLGLKSKPSFSWRRKPARPTSSSSNISGNPMPEDEKAPTPPPIRSAPTSPRLSTVSERNHTPGLTRAQTAYLKRLLADPLSQQDNDPLAKLRVANSGEDIPAAGPSRTGLEQSLAAFTAVEVLEGENGYACKKCWKIKAGKYKSTHPNIMEEDEPRSPGTSPGLVAQGVASPPVPISASTSQGSIEHLASPGVNRAASTASRSSAGRPFRAPSPLRAHTEARQNSFDFSSIKSNEYSSIASTASVESVTIEPPIDPDSDGLSNTSSSSEDDYSHLETTIPSTRPGMPARKKSSHFIMRRAFKRYLIAKAPEVLVFHFKRFKQTQKAIMAFTNFYDLKKMDDYVSFPERLDLAPYMAPNRQDYKVVQTAEGPKAPFMDWQSPDQAPDLDPVMYRLYAVVVHMGSINEGHYIAYVLVDPQRMFGRSAEELDGVTATTNGMNNVSLNESTDGERKQAGLKIRPDRRVWCFCSDTSIRLADVDEVLAAKAYLCFYEKVI